MNVYIYQNNKLVAGVIAPSLEEFNENPTKFYPMMPEGLFITSENKYEHPIIVGAIVREKTREERILLDNETELLLPGEYVENNEIVFVECPTGLYKPVWITSDWVEGASLEEVQEIKRVELKGYRDTEIYAPYLYAMNGYFYDADLDSRNRLFQAQQLGVGTTNNVNWITADNQISSISNEDLNNIVNGIAIREQEAFNKFSSKYNQVLNLTSIEEIKNIAW